MTALAAVAGLLAAAGALAAAGIAVMARLHHDFEEEEGR